mmetsp:Transcript_34894/g.137918  ORF Transcript_34894/g.137918 Transcript_34894/m.137918 type:complete len:80 (-) Transcript_34894:2520-2759(-)
MFFAEPQASDLRLLICHTRPWQTPEAALAAVEEFCRRMRLDCEPRFIALANRSDAIAIVARIFKQDLLDGDASADVHAR